MNVKLAPNCSQKDLSYFFLSYRAVRAILCLVHIKYFVIIDSNIVTVSRKDCFLTYTVFRFIALPVLTLVLAALCRYLSVPTERPQLHGHPARNLGINVVLFALHSPDSKFCKYGLMMVNWPKHIIRIKINKIYYCVWLKPETFLFLLV
jgi:hypothetical protein